MSAIAEKITEAGGGYETRRLAIKVLQRMETSGAFVNILLPKMLEKSRLEESDRKFVTEMVYGTTRMKRACDHICDQFLTTEVDDEVRAALRVGAYQLYYLGTPAHAGVDATVGAIEGKGRSVVNAVLRKVAGCTPEFPDQATELSYPDWIAKTLATYLDPTLGPESALKAMKAMNKPAKTHMRDDGYVQDMASQLVVELIDGKPGELIVDLCAAPGGKATGIAATGATVLAGDRKLSRAKLVRDNAQRTGAVLSAFVGLGENPPLREGVADKVLIDAPCSGLGSLRRRPDARWRIEPEAPKRLAAIQVNLINAGLKLLKPGGVLTYSVCTLGETEGSEVVAKVIAEGEAEQVPLEDKLSEQWHKIGLMSVLSPQETDGMMAAQLKRKS